MGIRSRSIVATALSITLLANGSHSTAEEVPSADSARSADAYTRDAVSSSHDGQPVIHEFKGRYDSIGPFAWTDLHGRRWTELDLRGQVVIVALWAAWCGPCIDEFPALQRLSDLMRHHSSVTFISLNVDRDVDDIQQFLLDFSREYSFPVLFAGKQLKITALPYTWIVDREGYIRETLPGSGPGWEEEVQALARKVEKSVPVSELPPEVIRKQRAENEREGMRSR
jgi:thiol-disulfide isomerase/thioredoxin